MQLPVHRLPLRDYQKEIVEAYNDPKIDEMLLVIGRRGAKTTTTYSECIVPNVVKEVMTAVGVYPTAKMGFDNFWTNIEDDGFKTLDHLPGQLLVGSSNTQDDMRQSLINGSVFRVLGSTNYEALRGANGKVYWFDEFADQPIEAVNVVAPITEANGGKRIYTGTPKIDGINGETMRRMHESFKKDKTGTKYTCYIDATHYMTPEQLEKSRQGYILRNGNDFKFRQEMLLDWGQAGETSYYGQIVSQMRKKDSIGKWAWDAAYPVYTAWDLGMSDALAIAFFQVIEGKVRIIDFLETQDFALNSVVPFLKTKPYVYGWHFLPHDGAVRSANDNISRLDYLHRNGITNASTLRREGVTIGIDRVLERLPNAFINEGTTTELVRKLPIYKRKRNPQTGDYIGPDHKSESHAADCIRYLFTAIHYYFDKKGNFLLENNVQETAPLELNHQELETTYYF